MLVLHGYLTKAALKSRLELLPSYDTQIDILPRLGKREDRISYSPTICESIRVLFIPRCILTLLIKSEVSTWSAQRCISVYFFWSDHYRVQLRNTQPRHQSDAMLPM